MHNLSITYRSPQSLSLSPRNARTHSRHQIKQIAQSIAAFGFTNPILVDEHDVIIAGHGRLVAARDLGLDQVPTIGLHHLTETQKRGLMLADNKIALNAGWDMDLLAIELADLSQADKGFDVDLTRFEVGEIDIILDGGSKRPAETVETVPLPSEDVPAITRPGDLWHLGPHRVLCGDARSGADFETLMGSDRADAGFTDPPYNVPINGHVPGKGAVKHREFAVASGEMSEVAFAAFLSETLGQAAAVSVDGAVWFACMDWRHIGELLRAGKSNFDALLNLCVWAKTNGGMGSLYRSQHELVFVFRKGRAGHRNNVQLGRFGRNRTNLWSYAGVNTFRPGRMEELQAHPTAKPVEMIKDALLDVTARDAIVLDPFAGAGSTLIAANRIGRRARLMEIDPAYVDVILGRWIAETGDDPVRDADGASFSELQPQRSEKGQSDDV